MKTITQKQPFRFYSNSEKEQLQDIAKGNLSKNTLNFVLNDFANQHQRTFRNSKYAYKRYGNIPSAKSDNGKTDVTVVKTKVLSTNGCIIRIGEIHIEVPTTCLKVDGHEINW